MPDIPFVCGRYIPGHEKIIELLIGACNCTYTRSSAYFLSAADAREETCRRKLIAPAGLLIGVEIVFRPCGYAYTYVGPACNYVVPRAISRTGMIVFFFRSISIIFLCFSLSIEKANGFFLCIMSEILILFLRDMLFASKSSTLS